MTHEQLALAVGPQERRRGRSASMSEARLLAAVCSRARRSGWLVFHCADSRRSIGPGFPDLVLAHERQRRVIFAELKTEAGGASYEQEVWLTVLFAAGAEVALWRPGDLDEVAGVLRGRRLTEPACEPVRLWPGWR